MWGRLWPFLLSFLTATAVPGPSLRRPSRELDATPRMTIPYEELSGTRHFKGQAQNYSTLLLEEASARLLVGARGALFSLNAQDIGDGTHKEIRWEASPEMQSKCHQKGKNNQVCDPPCSQLLSFFSSVGAITVGGDTDGETDQPVSCSNHNRHCECHWRGRPGSDTCNANIW